MLCYLPSMTKFSDIADRARLRERFFDEEAALKAVA
jgi:hypothetical protein